MELKLKAVKNNYTPRRLTLKSMNTDSLWRQPQVATQGTAVFTTSIIVSFFNPDVCVPNIRIFTEIHKLLHVPNM